MKQWLIFLLIFLTFNYRADGNNEKVIFEEYAVYSAILNRIKISPSDGKRAKLLVINDRTTGPVNAKLIDQVGGCEKGLLSRNLKPLLKDMLTKNHRIHPLRKHFKLTKNYTLLSQKRYADFFETRGAAGWDDFYKKYRHGSGYNTFSRVGFNFNKTKAIVFTEISCNVICGYFRLILLNKQHGKWRVSAEFGCK